MSRPAWADHVLGDLRFTCRSLARSPGFAATILGTLILGIGVTTFMYQATGWILFRGRPYPHMEQIYFVGNQTKEGPTSYYIPGLYLPAFEQQVAAFSDLAGCQHPSDNLVLAGEPLAARVCYVTAHAFSILGIQPVLGRGFRPDEFKGGNDGVLIISHAFWRQTFNLDPAVLGRTIMVRHQPCVIVGVLGSGQEIPRYLNGDVYRPLDLRIDPQKYWDPYLNIFGRLKTGISPGAAMAGLALVKLPPVPAWASDYLSTLKLVLTNITEMDRKNVWWVMLAAGLFLYAIACLNTTNLMVIRLLGRRRELSIRFAVGGSRWQIMRLVAYEGLLLSFLAGVVVRLAAHWVFPYIFALLNRTDAAGNFRDFWDWKEWACVSGLSLVASLAATVVPASRLLRADINSGLKDGGPALGESRNMARLRTGFVVLQAAFAVVLLIGTGLFIRSFERLHATDLGFDIHAKAKVWVNIPEKHLEGAEERIDLLERIKARLATIPGVKSVSYGQDSLLQGGFWGNDEMRMADGTFKSASRNFVAPDYYLTAGLRLREGRWFSAKKLSTEVVINEALAQSRFPQQDPVGQYLVLKSAADQKLTIVGVIKDVRESIRESAHPQAYCSATLSPDSVYTLILQLSGEPPTEFGSLVRRGIYGVDDSVVTSQVRSFEQLLVGSMWAENYAAKLLKGLSAIALGLTIVGLFSVIVHTVDSRMGEFGVRLALGATGPELRRLVMVRGITAAAFGIVLGIGGSLALTRFMESMLYETSSYDPGVYAAVSAILIAAAVLACWVPARRAAGANPVRLLKSN